MERIAITINGEPVETDRGATVAAAVLNAGITQFRKSVTGEARGPLCGMGVCFECRVTIDGLRHQKSCQITVREMMKIETDAKN